MVNGDQPAQQQSSLANVKCKKCKINEATILVRTDGFCRDCFVKYVHTKAVKRLESFRVRHSAFGTTRKFCLPMSFGISSISLLYILDRHLKGQTERTGRTGFGLHLLFIDTSSIEEDTPSPELAKLLQEQFPQYPFETEPLWKILSDENNAAFLSEIAGISATTLQDRSSTPEVQLQHILANLPSATSRSDVVSILRTRLIAQIAQNEDCEGIFWGDTTTRLAAKTLAETAKGRGYSLPWQIADGESPHGIPSHYPLRDLLKKELVSHIEFGPSFLVSLIHEPSNPQQISVSAKSTTIDDLMRQYFESVEENYPGIVANVVRTTGKLEQMPTNETDRFCRLCNMRVAEAQFGIHGWGGDQHFAKDSNESSGSQVKSLCYGCARSTNSRKR